MSTILVTGSLGTIGKPLVQELQVRGHKVFGCDLDHGEDEYGARVHSEGHYHRCDVSDFRQLYELINRVSPDYVYHTAAEFGRWNGEDFYEQLWKTNAIGTKHMIRLQEECHFNRLVFFSSSEVYGEMDGVMTEDLGGIGLLNDYALSKWVNECQIRNSIAEHQTESVIVRIFNTYGPGERYSPYRSVNCRFLYYAMKRKPLTVFKGHKRTSTYVSDTVRTLANIHDHWCPGEIYNIAGKEEHSIERLADIAVEVMGASTDLIHYEDSEPMTTTRKRVDTEKAERHLHHRVTIGIEEGMRGTAEWMRKTYL